MESPNKKGSNRKSLAPLSYKNEMRSYGTPLDDRLAPPVLEDKTIAPFFDQQFFPDEFEKYQQMKMNEKMIVNLVQCLVHSGHSVFSDFILEKLCKTYNHIEHKLKFRNKGLYYLMSLFDKNVFNMLKKRSQRIIQQKKERSRNVLSMSKETVSANAIEKSNQNIDTHICVDDEPAHSVSTKHAKNKRHYSKENSPTGRYSYMG